MQKLKDLVIAFLRYVPLHPRARPSSSTHELDPWAHLMSIHSAQNFLYMYVDILSDYPTAKHLKKWSSRSQDTPPAFISAAY